MKRRITVLLFCAALMIPVPVLTGAGPENNKIAAGTLIYESPVFIGSGEEFRPKQEIKEDGKLYRLAESELQRAVKDGRKQFVSSWISFSLEGNWDSPGTAEIMVEDEDTGQKKEYTVPKIEVKETGREWSDDFSFSVTVSGYGADSFWLGETEIPGDVPLVQFGSELLYYLKLPEDCYQVEAVEWAGEPYEQDGILCRDAWASGKKLVRNVEARYGGQVELPPVEGMKYYCVYEEVVEESRNGELKPAERQDMGSAEEVVHQSEEQTMEISSESAGSLLERVFRWLIEHITVVRIGAVFLAGILMAVLLLVLSGRRKKGEEM